jgi:transcriptional regulator with XRE-family HTH domain
MNLADAIRAWRHHHELSIREAAERIGIDRSALHRLEKGEELSRANAFTVVRWLLN